MLYETFRAQVVAEYQPAPDSPLMRALLEADELHAQHEAARPAHTAAVGEVQKLRTVVYKPVPVGGLGSAKAAEHARHSEELRAALGLETAAAAELNRLYQQLRAKQKAIVAMIASATVDDAARRAIMAEVTGRVS